MGATELRLSDLRTLLDRQDAEAKKQLLESTELLDRFIRTEMFRRALLAEAKGKGWDRRPEVVAQMERAREQALVTSYINDVARPARDYPSEAEIQAFYKAAEAELTAPRQFQIAQVYIAAGDEKAGDARRRKAEEIAARARGKQADFAAIARAESEHKPSAEKGGELGWLAETEMLAEVRAVVAGAAKGDIVGPVRVGQGWHVVKILDIKPAQVRPLAEVRDGLVALMRQRRAQEIERRYLDELAEKNPMAVNQIALGRVKPEAAKR